MVFSSLEFLFLLLLGAAALVRGAAWLHVPYPIALVLVGLAAGAVPGLPEVVLEPEVVFLVFLCYLTMNLVRLTEKALARRSAAAGAARGGADAP